MPGRKHRLRKSDRMCRRSGVSCLTMDDISDSEEAKKAESIIDLFYGNSKVWNEVKE